MEGNATIKFLGAYFKPGVNAHSLPEFVQIAVKGEPPQTWFGEILLPMNKLNITSLRAQFPFLDMGTNRHAVDQLLTKRLEEGLRTGKIPRGYCFYKLGAVEFADGSLRFLRGDTLYPCYIGPYMLAPEIADIALTGDGTSYPKNILAVLRALPPQALLTVAYTALTSVRSQVLGGGVDLQAVMYITGKNGRGKSRLAKRTMKLYYKRETKTPVGIVEADSSDAATDYQLNILRDMPVIAEDLCLSTGRATERKRREQGARLIRRGASENPTSKKLGKTIVESYCNAGLVLTAEFSMETLSDLNRCLIVPISDYLDLPAELTPQLIGDAIRIYSSWFARHCEEELNRLKTELAVGNWKRDLEFRIRTNYLCLRWAFQSLVAALVTDDLPLVDCEELSDQMDEALDIALAAHGKMRRDILDQIPVGNLAAILYAGYKNDDFDLASNPDKLAKHEGTVWKKISAFGQKLWFVLCGSNLASSSGPRTALRRG